MVVKTLNNPHFVKCGPYIKPRDWRSLPTKELTRAERNMRFIEDYLNMPTSDGRIISIKLIEAQECFIYSLFDNPGLGIFRDEKDLEEQLKQAQRLPALDGQARNLLLNMRVNTESPFVSKTVWQENGDAPSDVKGKKVFGGLDLSSVSDLTALVFVTEDGDVISRFWLPADGLREKSRNDRVPYDVWAKDGVLSTTPGAAIEYEYIAYELKRIFDEYDVVQINFDRFAMKFLNPWLKKANITENKLSKFKEFGQTFGWYGQAIRTLEGKLLQRKLKHGNNPIMTMCAGNARIVMDPQGNRMFTKSKSTGRIDGLVALAMAVDALARYEENAPKEYKIFFV